MKIAEKYKCQYKNIHFYIDIYTGGFESDVV